MGVIDNKQFFWNVDTFREVSSSKTVPWCKNTGTDKIFLYMSIFYFIFVHYGLQLVGLGNKLSENRFNSKCVLIWPCDS